jgi:hypothetical protein
MARVIGSICTVIVGLQVLIGVPLAVCLIFFCLTSGQISVDVKTDQTPAVVLDALAPPHPLAVAVTPPANAIPAASELPDDNPILQSRAAVGSPLAGTLLETADFTEEQSTFVAALEKAAAEHIPPLPAASVAADACPTGLAQADAGHAIHDQAIVQHLYHMAELDEQAGQYPRADQWRAFAREIRSEQPPAGEPSGEIAISPEGATVAH